MNTREQVQVLATLTTRDEAGRHFTERYSESTLEELEEEGLIAISRPVHGPTSIPYDRQYWTLEVTPAGVNLVQDNPEHWPPAD